MKNIEDILKLHYGDRPQNQLVAQSIENLLSKAENLPISDVIGISIPKPPEPPLNRVLREGVGHFCNNCGSTVSKDGFLQLFGEMLCHNQKCPNNKSKKNYR